MNVLLLSQSIRLAAKAEFSRSSGPGGQNVNKVNTKVSLRIHLDDLAGLSEAEAKRMRDTLSSRITGSGELIITSSEERSQHINLQRAYTRMEAIITNAAKLPRIRRPTKPSRAAKEERLRTKRLRGQKKAGRSFTPDDKEN